MLSALSTLSCEYFWKFLKKFNGPKWDTLLKGLGETISEKTWNQNSHGTVPLNFILHVQIEQQNWKPQILSVIPIQLKATVYSMTVNPPPHSHTQKGKQIASVT